MRKVNLYFILSVLIFTKSFAQILVTSPTFAYTETFGNTSVVSWTDNTAAPNGFTGWYLAAGGTFNYGGQQTITGAAPINVGGFYTYICTSGTNIKLGGRPSNGSGGSSGSGLNYMAMRLINNTGTIINSIRVAYTGYQMSLAQNQNNVNQLTFSYQTGVTMISATAGGWTAVPALDYTAPNDDNSGNSSQLTGYPCTVSTNLVATCIAVTIPVGNEIMLRWCDLNNPANDPHLAIDNITVTFYSNTTVNPNTACSTLPITLTDFYAKPNESLVNLNWRIETEINVDHYIIERSTDGLNFAPISTVKSIAETNGSYNLNYSTIDHNPKNGINYYRLINVDNDGSKNYNKTIMVNFNQTHSSSVWVNQTEKDIIVSFEPNFTNKTFYLMDMNGKKIGEYKNLNTELNYFTIDKLNLPLGLYVIGCLDAVMPPQKLLIN